MQSGDRASANGSLAASGVTTCFTAFHFASFTAMEVNVTIFPRFTMPRISTPLGGLFGPFSPNSPTDVPLWLALHIRQTDTCTIQPPPYVALPYLRGLLEREKESEATFEALPFYFFELVKKLCENSAAAEDIPHVAEVVRLTEEVKAIRRQKLQQSMAVFEAEGSPVFIPGIKLPIYSHHELHTLRTSFAIVLQQSAEMKHRRERLIGAPIETSMPSTRPSGIATSVISSSSAAAAGETRLSDYISGVSGSISLDTPSRPTATSAPVAVPDANEGGASLDAETLTESLRPATDESTAPPVKKRRTLRQT
uniref:Uncharacterized protein n=1 Tax=Trypanosoma vivax (strain Y486) TaxID=1055687 RepID=G0UCT9_TRYVY|nr:conserved hypothetical protein [Trypanosoma vivax Y486]